MKKSILILILAGLLTACVPTENAQESSEISTAQAVTEASETEEILESESYDEADTQPSTECEISTTEATVTTAEIQSETVCKTTAVTDVQKEKSQYDPTEDQQEKADVIAENPTDHTESSTENASEESSRSCPSENSCSNENPNCPPGSPGEPEEYEEEAEPPMGELSDYEKALEVYNFMTANGGGTCVQYAYQTYEMCQEYGLECYFAWTENQLYGHVANVVRVDGVWYVLDTQAGCFLTENMCGFTEIVDANESYIASADIISGMRYE